MHGRPLALAVGLIAAFPTPAAAAPAGSGAWGATAADAGVARLERTRELASAGSLADAFRAAASLSDIPAAPLDTRPVALPAGVPGPMAAPVARLLSAIEAASATSEAAVGPGIQDLFAELTDAFLRLGDARGLARTLAGLEPRIEATVDRAALASAGLAVTSALDDALPALRAYAGSRPPSSEAAVGCDVVDAPPALCIGNTGANTYGTDYTLLIDLGGDDTHANGGGAGLPFTNSLVASLEIDLAGNDTYAPTIPRLGTNLGAHAAQGVGWFGGIGGLVDVAGNDRYTVNVSEPKDYFPFSPWPVYAQAYSAAGVGILADLEGDDRFEISNRAAVDHAWVQARGYATLGGISLFLDRAGNDTHLIEGAPTPYTDKDGVPHAGSGQAMGFGDGPVGTALFVDAAGNDTMTARASPGLLPEDTPGDLYSGGAHAFGFGAGLVGDAAALLGPGTQKLLLEARSAGPQAGLGYTLGYGFGTLGFGGLDDAGGDDVYGAVSELRAVRHLTLDDSCACSGAILDSSTLGSAIAQTHAVGAFGVGALVDRGGNDQYLTTAHALGETVLRDERTQDFPPSPDGGPRSLDVTGGTGGTYVTAQGDAFGGTASLFGVPAFVHGAAALRDLGGNDIYRIDASAESITRATSAIGAPISTHVIPTNAWTWGQAAADGVDFFGANPPLSFAELRDDAGADTYASSTSSVVTVDPPSAETAENTVRSSVQASVDRNTTALLLDRGAESDSFAASPADAACEGTRGVDVWRDCGPLAGYGVNRSV